MLWVADITYIPTWAGFLFVAMSSRLRFEQQIVDHRFVLIGDVGDGCGQREDGSCGFSELISRRASLLHLGNIS
jgi:hypothetical protein